jgi:hypothetical protein
VSLIIFSKYISCLLTMLRDFSSVDQCPIVVTIRPWHSWGQGISVLDKYHWWDVLSRGWIFLSDVSPKGRIKQVIHKWDTSVGDTLVGDTLPLHPYQWWYVFSALIVIYLMYPENKEDTLQCLVGNYQNLLLLSSLLIDHSGLGKEAMYLQNQR